MPTNHLVSPVLDVARVPVQPVSGDSEPQKAPPLPPKKARRSRAKWLLAASVLVVIAVAAVLYLGRSAAPDYVTVPVDRGDIEATITATGNTNAVVTVQVGSQVSGNILALNADFNTKVKKGQVVAKIDPALFQAKVDQARANLDSANSQVASARAGIKKADSDIAGANANVASQQANVVHAESAITDATNKNNRMIELVKQGVMAKQEAETTKATLDQAIANRDAAAAQVTASKSAVESAKSQRDVAVTQLDQAVSQVKQLTATLQQAQLDLAHTDILAPVDGTVISRNMDAGQTVAASFSAPTIFQIAQDLTKMQVDTNVDESDVGRVRVGQSANFTVDAYPGVVFPGVVQQIRQAPINVQNVITYDVVVQVANPDLKLFPGMTANVKIVTGKAADVLRVPMSALRFRPATARTPSPQGRGGGKGGGAKGGGAAAGMQTLYTLEAGVLKPVRVHLGLSDGTYTEITSGLAEGLQVVTGAATKGAAPAPPKGGQSNRRLGF